MLLHAQWKRILNQWSHPLPLVIWTQEKDHALHVQNWMEELTPLPETSSSFLNEVWMGLVSDEIHHDRDDSYDSNCSISALFKSEGLNWLSLEVRHDGAYCALYQGKNRQAVCSHRFQSSRFFYASPSVPALSDWYMLNRLLLLENLLLWISKGDLKRL
jgi:hypothetical protein